MNKYDTWRKLVEKNPSFEGIDPVELSPITIYRLFELVWKIAQEDVANKRDTPDFIKSLFGNLK